MSSKTKPLPPFMPYPTFEVRNSISTEIWQSSLDLWSKLSRVYLGSSPEKFKETFEKSHSLIPFLRSFVSQEAELHASDMALSQENALYREVFLLTDRVFREAPKPDDSFADSAFLGDFCTIYKGSPALSSFLDSVWTRIGAQIRQSLSSHKQTIIKYLEENRIDEKMIRRLSHLVRAYPDIGVILMTGPDLIDAMAMAYPQIKPQQARKLLTFAYLNLISLLHGPKPQMSLLFDHIYSLKTSASPKLLSDLVNMTPLESRIAKHSGTTPSSRTVSIIEVLHSLHDPTAPKRRKKTSQPTISKGKSRATHSTQEHELYIHRMSLITQIQDLFPDLGSAFIARLLDEYNDDVETTTAHLLENDLPPHLNSLDRSATLAPPSSSSPPPHPDLAPRSTPPPPSHPPHTTRAPTRVPINHNKPASADALLAQPISSTAKSRILAALAAFDADDDERDDTYDLADVGGTVDAAEPEPGARSATRKPGVSADSEQDSAAAAIDVEIERALFAALRATPGVFERGAQSRRSKEKVELRKKTGWADEQIEGWGVMVERMPEGRRRRLEERCMGFGGAVQGQQRELGSSRWVADGDGSEEEDGEEQDGRPGGAVRGRGGGFRGRGRARGNVAGSSSERGTQVQRRRKEANKSARANHNRKDQSARKTARGFGVPPG